ncbi:MAG: hypothetical protein CFE22_01285 [Cytophagaceae bacterium BCCC1]|nr:MAG: hypothetical protein CFE22_01285 [Cytophagaceae bacterium BCCC1]
MKKVLIIAFVTFISLACKKDKVEPTNLSQSELLSLNSWQLNRYTDSNGKTLTNAELNIAAIALYGLQFEFRADKETRAVDKITKNILNRGTWELLTGNTVLDINITSFKGQFKIVTLSKGKLTLQASTGNFLSGVGSEINMEFIESKN